MSNEYTVAKCFTCIDTKTITRNGVSVPCPDCNEGRLDGETDLDVIAKKIKPKWTVRDLANAIALPEDIVKKMSTKELSTVLDTLGASAEEASNSIRVLSSAMSRYDLDNKPALIGHKGKEFYNTGFLGIPRLEPPEDPDEKDFVNEIADGMGVPREYLKPVVYAKEVAKEIVSGQPSEKLKQISKRLKVKWTEAENDVYTREMVKRLEQELVLAESPEAKDRANKALEAFNRSVLKDTEE